jgi:hypothetical protein
MTLRVVSYGGGTNSTALLIGLKNLGLRPDAILFADTGGEKPHTYRHLEVMQHWLQTVGFPPITTVRANSRLNQLDGGLEGECLRLGKLPAKAYGFSSCSDNWKIRPQNRWVRNFAKQHGVRKAEVIRLIGFDADEPSRVERALNLVDKKQYPEQYPLYEWGWGREECLEAIRKEGLPPPGKSACFFCPSSTKAEILWLSKRHPDLMARALEIERRAVVGVGPAPRTTVNGLGRRLNWAAFLEEVSEMSEEEKEKTCNRKVFFTARMIEEDCGCYDG